MKTIKASAFDDMRYGFTGIIEHSDGTREWFYKDEYHREDGPAVEYADGTKVWYLNGKYHREDGPAWEDADGTKRWFVYGSFVYALHKSIVDYIVVEDGLPSTMEWLGEPVSTLKVLTAEGIKFIPNLPGI